MGKGMQSKSHLMHFLAFIDDWIIYYNKPTLLDIILTSSNALLDDEEYVLVLEHFFQVCELLQRTECLQVVLKHGYIPEQTAVIASERAEKLVRLLVISKPVLNDTIIQSLKQIPYLSETLKETTPKSKMLLSLKNPGSDPEILKAVLDCGFDVNTATGYPTPFIDILKGTYDFSYLYELGDFVKIRKNIGIIHI